MADITKAIMADIESDATINITDICLDESAKGFFKKRRTLSVHGKVKSVDQKDRIMKLVEKHAGDAYAIVDKLSVK